MEVVSQKSFFLVIPTRERKAYLLNLLKDFECFSDYINNCVIVDQSIEFLGDDFDYTQFGFKITILKGDPNQGVNHSRNLALTQYKLENWLFFLDDDLRIPAIAFEQILKYLTPNIIDVLIPGIQFEGMERDVKHSSMLHTIAKPNNFSKGRFRLQVCSGLNIVKKEIFYEAGFYFDENFTIWGDDWDYGMRLLQAGANIYFQPKILVEHMQASIGGQRSKAKELNLEMEKQKLYFYFLRKHFSKNVVKREYYNLLISTIFAYRFQHILKLRLIFKAYKLSKEII